MRPSQPPTAGQRAGRPMGGGHPAVDRGGAGQGTSPPDTMPGPRWQGRPGPWWSPPAVQPRTAASPTAISTTSTQGELVVGRQHRRDRRMNGRCPRARPTAARHLVVDGVVGGIGEYAHPGAGTGTIAMSAVTTSSRTPSTAGATAVPLPARRGTFEIPRATRPTPTANASARAPAARATSPRPATARWPGAARSSRQARVSPTPASIAGTSTAASAGGPDCRCRRAATTTPSAHPVLDDPDGSRPAAGGWLARTVLTITGSRASGDPWPSHQPGRRREGRSRGDGPPPPQGGPSRRMHTPVTARA